MEDVDKILQTYKNIQQVVEFILEGTILPSNLTLTLHVSGTGIQHAES